jgi:YggT family protein
MESFLYNFVYYLFTALTIAIFGRVLLSWFPMNPDNPIVVILTEVTDPILKPLRRIVPTLGMLDLTPIVALVLLQLIQSQLLKAIAGG